MTKDNNFVTCPCCGKKFYVRDNQLGNKKPMPKKCKECRIGTPILEGETLKFKGKRSITYVNGEYVVQKNNFKITKSGDTDYLAIIKLCVGIIPKDPDGVILNYYNNVVRRGCS